MEPTAPEMQTAIRSFAKATGRSLSLVAYQNGCYALVENGTTVLKADSGLDVLAYCYVPLD